MFKLFASPSALLLLACSEATASGNIAVIGGVNSNEIITEANTEVTQADWKIQPKQTLKLPRSGVAAASLDGTLYAFGGLKDDGTAVTNCEELDTTKSGGGWSKCADLLEPLQGHAAAAHAGKVYAIGGIQGPNPNEGATAVRGQGLMILDTQMGGVKQWVDGQATMNWARSWTAAVAVAGKLYVIGGINGMGRAEDTSEVFDTAAKKTGGGDNPGVTGPTWGWVYLKNADDSKVLLNTPRFGHAAAEYKGKIYVTGGVRCAISNKNYCASRGVNTNEFVAKEKSLEILDTKISPATNPRMSWTDGYPQLETQRQLHASAFIGGMLIVMGGSKTASTDTDTVASVEMLEVEPIGAAWVLGKPLKNMRQGIAAAAFTVTDANCELDPAVPGADDCTVNCGTLTQAITTVATGSGTCDPATYACQPGDKECRPSVDATAASVTAAAVALAGTKVAGFDVVANSVSVVKQGDDLIVRLTVEGDVDDFNDNEEAVKEALAQKLGVPKEWITLHVKAGSIVVTATVHNPDAVTVANTDCVVIWQPCNTNCLRLSDTTTEQSGTGSACPQTDPEPACVDGEGRCVIDANSQVSDASHANLALVVFMVVMTSLQLVCY